MTYVRIDFVTLFVNLAPVLCLYISKITQMNAKFSEYVPWFWLIKLVSLVDNILKNSVWH